MNSMNRKTISEPARETTVAGEYDVAVCGGGIAGCIAAVAAARAGANVVLIERYGTLGGLTTNFQVPEFYCLGTKDKPYITGILDEILEQLDAHGGWIRWDHGGGIADAELLKWVLLELCDEAGVSFMLHSTIAGLIMENNAVKGVLIEGKSGRRAVLADVTVDATGDGDLAEHAGAAYESGAEHGGELDKPHSVGLGVLGIDKAAFNTFKEQEPKKFRSLMDAAKKDGLYIQIWNSMGGRAHQYWPEDYMTVAPHIKGDANSTEDLTRMEIEGLRAGMELIETFRKSVPGWGNARLARIAPQFGVREGRRYVGDYVLKIEDLQTGRHFEDAVYRNWFGPTKTEYEIPYRCLLPKNIDGLLIGCRALSVAADVFPTIRLIGQAFGIGQAAGAAAGLAAARKAKPRDLNAKDIQDILTELGAAY